MCTISLCMIVKNEEDVLARCLSSVAPLVDEIIIVDTGSTDQTKQIAATFTDQVVDFAWIDDFAAARNFAFSLASKDYCMWLDADDVITPEDAKAFLEMKEALTPNINVVMMPYHTGFDENGKVTFSYYRERIIKNHAGMEWKGAVHEVITPIGEKLYAECAVSHHKLHPSDPDRNLRIFEAQIQKGIPLDARQQFYYGRELYYHQRYQDALETFEAFLVHPDAWLENKIDACCHCAFCLYRLGEPDKALQALLRSLHYDLPRAEVCCEIGKHFFDQTRWNLAAFWYTLATTCQLDQSRGGFTSPDCYGYLPCIQLCVCYSRLGDMDKAIRFNELAATYKPDAAPVKHNRAYFASLTENSDKTDESTT